MKNKLKLNQKKLGVILSYLNLIISALVNIINVPLFLSCIGVGEYGIYETIGSLTAYFSILDFGLPATIVVFYSRFSASKDNINKDNVLALCSRIYVFITVAILIVGSSLYFSLDSLYASSLTSDQLLSAKHIYIIFLINVACTLPFQIFNAIITAHERFIFLKGTTLLITIVQAIVVVLAVLNFPSALSIIVVQTVFNLIVSVLRYYYCFRILKIKIKLHFFDKKLFKSILNYSFFIFLNVIADQLFWRSNLIILSVFGNASSVVAYSITFRIVYNYMILSTAITSVFLPGIASMVSKGVKSKDLSGVFIKVARLQFILLSCIVTGFILFGKKFIYMWSVGKPGLEDSYLMTLLLLIPLTFDLVQGISQNILQAMNKFYLRVIVFLVINFINIGLAVPLSKIYGGLGCAAVTSLLTFLFVAVLNVFYKKILDLDMETFWKQIFKLLIPVLSCLIIGVFINYIKLERPILDFSVKIILYVIIYIMVMWKFAMNEYEKSLFKRPINKIKNVILSHKN